MMKGKKVTSEEKKMSIMRERIGMYEFEMRKEYYYFEDEMEDNKNIYHGIIVG